MTAVFVSRRFFNIGHVYGKELQEKLKKYDEEVLN